jgi:hypothetical protein
MKRPLKVKHQERRRELPDSLRYSIYFGYLLFLSWAILQVLGTNSFSDIWNLNFLHTDNGALVGLRFVSIPFVVFFISLPYKLVANRWVQGEWRESLELIPYNIVDAASAVDRVVRNNAWTPILRRITSDFSGANFKVVIPWELFKSRKIVFVLLKEIGVSGKATELYVYSGCACMVDWGQNQKTILNLKTELFNTLQFLPQH